MAFAGTDAKASIKKDAAMQVAATYGCIVLWVVLSAGVIMVNKYVLAYSGFPFPVSLTLIHMLFCSSVATLLITTGIVQPVNMSNELYFRGVVPIALLFALVLWLGNAAYMYLSVSFIQMLKAAMPITVFTAGIMLGTEKYELKLAVNLVVIAVGVGIASYGEMHFVLIGLILQGSSVILESFRLGLIQIILQSKGIKLNPVTTLYYIAPACAAFLCIPFYFLELPKMLDPNSVWQFNSLLLLGSAVSALALNLAIFLLIGRTSALTMNVAGVLKDWLLIGLSVAIFGSEVTMMQLGGYCIAFLGVLSYNNTKNLAQTATKPVAIESSMREAEESLLEGKLGAGRV